MQVTSTQLQIGPYELKPVPTGIFGLDGGAMFGTVPKVLWEKTNPPDDHNRIQMEARALLLKGEKHKVLIDCGVGGDFIEKYGEKLGPKFAEMYAVDRTSTSMERSLAAAGLKPTDITDVILTHLHFDHAGGATKAEGGRLVPSFPNARYYVQEANLETARQPNIREKASYFTANFQPLIDAGVLTVLRGPIENLLPGISVQVTNGHTQGQQIVRVSDGQKTLVYCGDLIPTSTHIRLAWVMGYDLDPLLLIDEKRALLEPAARGEWCLFFEHDPFVSAATVDAVKGDFAVKKAWQLT